MKSHKINHEMFKYIALSGMTRFSGMSDIAENRGQTMYNTDIHFGNPPVWNIPEEVVEKVLNLDIDTISDQINIDLT